MARIHDEFQLIQEIITLCPDIDTPFSTPYGEMELIRDFNDSTLCKFTDKMGTHVMPLRNIVKYILRRYW